MSASNAHAQIDRLVDEVRNRVNDAATAASIVLTAEGHRLEANRLLASGRDDEARTELEIAAKIVSVTGEPTVQSDLLLHHYASGLQRSLGAIEAFEQRDALYSSSTLAQSHPSD